MGIEDIADRLESIAEELDDLVIEQLRMATSFLAAGEDVDPAVLKEERRIARARRAVSKAAASPSEARFCRAFQAGRSTKRSRHL
jgi:hypothetical protein